MADFLKLYEKFKETAAERKLIEDGDAVIAAISGGRDSTALLLLLKRLAGENKTLKLTSFHFNHSLRGGESDGDAEFAEELSEKLGIEFYSERGDVRLFAGENKLSIETAARELRYKALRRLAEVTARKYGRPVKIAVAHTAEDRAETVFLNIVRGTSVDGLEGIRYKNGDIIRPMLDFTKDDVETVCGEFGAGYRTDSTNFERIGKRNILRLDVFPYIDEKMNCDTVERLLCLSKLAADDSDLISSLADKAFGECVLLKENGDVELFPEKILLLHISLRSRVIRKSISAAGKDGTRPYRDCVSVSTDMVERTMRFIGGGSGTLELGKGLFCAEKGGKYVLTAEKKARGRTAFGPYGINIPSGPDGESRTDCGNMVIKAAVSEGADVKKALSEAAESGEKTALFDLDELTKIIEERGERLVLRAPEEGDRIRPLGAGGGKSLGRFLTDRKIYSAERDGIRIIAVGKDVLHVFGVRRSDAAALRPDSKRAVSFEITDD